MEGSKYEGRIGVCESDDCNRREKGGGARGKSWGDEEVARFTEAIVDPKFYALHAEGSVEVDPAIYPLAPYRRSKSSIILMFHGRVLRWKTNQIFQCDKNRSLGV